MDFNKQSLFVQYFDNFLTPKELEHYQKLITTLEYAPQSNTQGVYGFRHNLNRLDFAKTDVYKRIKNTFFKDHKLIQGETAFHLRHNANQVMVHTDTESEYNFLLYIKGEPLFNNGTGFYVNGELSSHVGWVENRAIFFNGNHIAHTDLQALGQSEARYTLNIFFGEPK